MIDGYYRPHSPFAFTMRVHYNFTELSSQFQYFSNQTYYDILPHTIIIEVEEHRSNSKKANNIINIQCNDYQTKTKKRAI